MRQCLTATTPAQHVHSLKNTYRTRSVSQGCGPSGFSPDGQYLQTNRGQIPLSLPLSSISSFQDKELSALFIKDQWVTLKEQSLLWLPPEYRPTCTAVYGYVICLGHSSGYVTILKIYPENISLCK